MTNECLLPDAAAGDEDILRRRLSVRSGGPVVITVLFDPPDYLLLLDLLLPCDFLGILKAHFWYIKTSMSVSKNGRSSGIMLSNLTFFSSSSPEESSKKFIANFTFWHLKQHTFFSSSLESSSFSFQKAMLRSIDASSLATKQGMDVWIPTQSASLEYSTLS